MDHVSNTFGIIRDVLLIIEKKQVTIDELLETMTTSSSLMRTEIESHARLARRFGFLDWENEEKLSVTITGKEFIKNMNALKEKVDENVEDVKIVDESSSSITLPPFCGSLPLSIKNNIAFTSDTMKRIAGDAVNEMYIVSPIINPSLLQSCFENVRRKPNATLTILTSEDDLIRYQNGPKGNLVLEEIGKLIKSRFRQGKVFYMKKDMSIAHAKIFCSDRSLFITSANIKKNSLTENFELGVYTERKDLINTVKELLNFLVDSGRAKCIYDTDIGVII